MELNKPTTSSFCAADKPQCVQVTRLTNNVMSVSDTKHPEQAPLMFTSSEWSAFIAGAKAGEFDVEPFTLHV